MSVLEALVKALNPRNKDLMNGDFLIDEDLLVHPVQVGVTKNSIFLDFQFICGLYLISQENPR